MRSAMRVSLFTPTHRPTFLVDLWESIKDQPFDEWVILANNGAQIPRFEDPRVRVGQGIGTFVGDLKYQACALCTGDILLEVDHDDLLLPGAVQAVRETFEANPEVGFVYSHAAYFQVVDGERVPTERFSPAHGWQYHQVGAEAPGLEFTPSWPPLPQAVSRIWYAPDHLRAWRRDVYWKAGGHDRRMRILDDQDLMARTYLLAPFRLIDRCLYLYRVTQENTWITHNKEIQDNVMRLHDQYIGDLASAWSDRRGLLKLDLGGRFNARAATRSDSRETRRSWRRRSWRIRTTGGTSSTSPRATGMQGRRNVAWRSINGGQRCRGRTRRPGTPSCRRPS